MKMHHYLLIFVILLAGYVIGVKHPSYGANVLAKIGM
jgi:uncharacterized protein HemY